jgi:hypothetical protein
MTIDRSRASSREKSVFSRREKLEKEKTKNQKGGGRGRRMGTRGFTLLP